MDLQDKNDTKTRRRKELLARRMGDAIDQLKPRGEAECPDAEIVAAYAEKALAPAESAHWEDHFASCARCRTILQVLTASLDAPLAEKEVAELGKLVSTVRGPVEIAGTSGGRLRPKFFDWRMRWLAPAFGVAAALAVWFAMRPPRPGTNRNDSETLVAQAPKQDMATTPAPSQLDRLSQSAPQFQKDEKAAPGSLAERSSHKDAESLSAPAPVPEKRREDGANEIRGAIGAANAPADLLRDNKKLGGSLGDREAPPASSAPAMPAAPPPLPKAQATIAPSAAPPSEAKDELDMAASEAQQLKEKSVTASGTPSRDKQAAALQSETGAIASGGARKLAPSDSQSNVSGGKPLLVFRPNQKFSSFAKSATGSIQWRAGAGGIIERSNDGGASWVSQARPSQPEWLAGAAVSDSICWLAGRNGAIARTTDGEHWQPVASPPLAATAQGKPPDWAGITATGAQTATITSNDQRRYTTEDGGQTWRLQP